jgi:hypothetical protein
VAPVELAAPVITAPIIFMLVALVAPVAPVALVAPVATVVIN